MRLALSPLLLAAIAVAQTQNEFLIYPERNGSSATYTDRFTGSPAVEIFQEVPPAMFQGVGDLGGTCFVRGIFHWATDENPTTQESYHILLRTGTSAAGPDPNPTGIIARAGPFNLPTGGSTRTAWRVSASFATPIMIPCSTGFFIGLDLPVAPLWGAMPPDGHSCWVADYTPPATWPWGDNPRAGAPFHAWRIIASVASPAPRATSMRLGVLLDAPVLNMGGIDPGNAKQTPAGSSNYAGNGMYPDISGNPRRDGLDGRIEDFANAGGTAHLILGTQITSIPPIPIPGIAGRLWLHPAGGWFYIGGVPLAGGIGTVPVVMPGTLPAALLGQSVAFQGLTAGAAGARFTNAQTVSF